MSDGWTVHAAKDEGGKGNAVIVRDKVIYCCCCHATESGLKGGLWWGEACEQQHNFACVLLAFASHLYGVDTSGLAVALMPALSRFPDEFTLPLSAVADWARTKRLEAYTPPITKN